MNECVKGERVGRWGYSCFLHAYLSICFLSRGVISISISPPFLFFREIGENKPLSTLYHLCFYV